jgi:hypothetical protein
MGSPFGGGDAYGMGNASGADHDAYMYNPLIFTQHSTSIVTSSHYTATASHTSLHVSRYADSRHEYSEKGLTVYVFR